MINKKQRNFYFSEQFFSLRFFILGLIFISSSFCFILTGTREVQAQGTNFNTFNKPADGTLLSSDWNNLLGRSSTSGLVYSGALPLGSFVPTFLPALMTGPLGINATPSQPGAGAQLRIMSKSGNNILELLDTSGSKVLTVLNSGNVGIGTTAPLGLLNILKTSTINDSSNVDAYPFLISNYSDTIGAQTGIAFRISTTQNNTPGAAITHERVGGYSQGGLLFKTRPGSTTNTPLATRMVINKDGYIGIGSTTPIHKLSIAGITTNYAIDAGGARIGNVAIPHLPNDVVTRTFLESSLGAIAPGGASSSWSMVGTGIYNTKLGKVGIGVNDPATLLSLANDSWISAKNQGGTGYVNMFKLNTNNQIEVGAPLLIGPFEFAANSGLVSFLDMPITASSPLGTPHGYVMKIDGNNILSVYSESNGSGGIQNKRVGIGTGLPRNSLEVVGNQSLPATSGTLQNGALRLSQPENGLVVDMGATSAAANGAWIQATNSNSLGTIYPILLNPNGGNIGIGSTTPIHKLSIYDSPTNYAIDAGDDRIGNVADPIWPKDVVTRGYLISSLGDVAPGGASSTWNLVGNNLTAKNIGWNVGIGLNNPLQKLDVSGKIALDGTTIAYLPTAFPGTLILGDGGTNLQTGADYNTFVGIGAGASNTTGQRNTANGYQSLYSNTTGIQNTANGMYSLFANTTGSNNTANGFQAGRYIANGGANATGSNSLFLGYETRAKANGETNQIVIGYGAIGNGSNTVTIGNDSITTTILKGNVGIGSTTPTHKLSVLTDSTNYAIDAGNRKIGNVGTATENKDVITKEYLDASLQAFAPGGASTTWNLVGNNLTAKNNGWNVGIGTTTPSTKLEVTGTVKATTYLVGDGTGALPSIAFVSQPSLGIYRPSANVIGFAGGGGGAAMGITNNNFSIWNTGAFQWSSTANAFGTPDVGFSRLAAGAISIDTGTVRNSLGTLIAGNVGIGLTNPSAPLTINQADDSNGFKLIGHSDPTTIFSFYIGSGGTNNPRFNSTKSMVFDANQGIYFRGPSGVYLNDNNAGNVYIANGGGNVGIGSTTPIHKLSVYGSPTDYNIDAGNKRIGNIADPTATKDAVTLGFLNSSLSAFNPGGASSTWNLVGNNLTAKNIGWNVGIGLTNPSQKLDVSGKIALDGTTIAYRPTAFIGTLILGDGGTNLQTGADYNTFVGIGAGANNTTGQRNTANGYQSLYLNTTGSQNTANGYQALFANTTGNNNTANGMYSLFANTTGSNNTANGFQAGRYIANGTTANATGSNSLFLGYDTRPKANGETNQIVIGYGAIGNGSNTVTIGNDNITTTILKGNVGIGSTTPTHKLSVLTDSTNYAIDAGNRKIGNVGTATENKDVITKEYLDASLQAFAPGGASTTWNLVGNNLTAKNNGWNVGIGTTTPGAKLDVYKSGTDAINVGSGVNFSGYRITSGSRQWAFRGSSNSMSFTDVTAGPLDRLNINTSGDFNFNSGDVFFNNTSGNVGIGTTVPGHKLSVTGSPTDYNIDAGNKKIGNVGTATADQDAVNLIFLRSSLQAFAPGGASSTWNLVGNNLTAKNNGWNVGIGTANPLQKLDVSGKIALDGTTIAYRPTAFTGTLILGDGGTYLETGADYNTFVGIGAGASNTTGQRNTANGYQSLYRNTTGSNNNANGMYSLNSNTTGSYNTANGYASLNSNTTGNNNTANGYRSLYLNTTGNNNTANGYQSLYFNTTGNNNTANGYQSLYLNTTGSNNTANGYQAGRYIANGTTANATGSNSLFLGYETRAKANGETNQIVIGYGAIGNGSNSVTLGNDDIVTTVLKGNVGIGSTTPIHKLSIADISTNYAIDAGNGKIGNVGTATADQDAVNLSFLRSSLSTLVPGGASSTWTISGNNIYNRNQTGNVGIGTTNPNTNLELAGSGATIRLSDSVSKTPAIEFLRGAGAFGSDVWGDYKIQNIGSHLSFIGGESDINNGNPVTYMTLSATGNLTVSGTGNSSFAGKVGVGTIAPYAGLEIANTGIIGSAGYAYGLLIKPSNTGLGARFAFTSGVNPEGSRKVVLMGESSQNLGDFTILTSANANLPAGTGTFSNRFIIQNSGNVGIGSTTPIHKLSIAGSTTNYNIDAGNKKIGNVGTATADQDAVNLSFLRSSLSTLVPGGASSTWTVSGNNIYNRNQTGNVGIGTTEPNEKLSVIGNIDFPRSTSGSKISFSGSYNQQMYLDYDYNNVSEFDTFVIRSNGNKNRLQINNNGTIILANNDGNVGIGSTSPIHKLSIAGSTTDYNIDAGNKRVGNLADPVYDKDAVTYGLVKSIFTPLIPGGASSTWTVSGNNIYNRNQTGNVGIGTNSPNQKLDVNGVITAVTGFRVNNSAGAAGTYLRSNATNFVASTIQASDIPTLNQNTTGSAYYLNSRDTRAVNDIPQDFSSVIKFDFKANTTNSLSDGGTYNGVMTWRKYGSSLTDFSGGPALQLAYSDNGNFWTRLSTSATTWGVWSQILNSNTGVKLQSTTPGTVQTGNFSISGNGLIGGNVGIGSTTPTHKLSVFTDSTDYAIDAGNRKIGNVGIATEDKDVITKEYLDASLQAFAPGGASTTWNLVGNNLTAKNTGWNVGIGTTTPQQKLDVSGKIALDGTTIAYRPTAFTGTLILGDGGTNLSNTTGSEGYYNTFVGIGAGTSNTTGQRNTANGMYSLYYNTTGNYNTANGMYSLYSNTTGNNNTANGMYSLYYNTTGNNNTANGMYSLYSNTTGNNNTANGYASLRSNTTGNYNTANGYLSLYYNTTGNNNTANGMYSLYYNTTGNNNTANGMYSLYSNTTGNNNTANGYASLRSNTTGNYNTANGYLSLYYNTTGNNNTANGMYSLYYNTTGNNNTANGMYSLYSNTTGNNNTANGMYSLYSNTTGSQNTGIGYNAGRYIANGGANETGSNSFFLGAETRAKANGETNQIVIGYGAIGNGSNSLNLANTIYATGINGVNGGNVGIGSTTPTHKLSVLTDSTNYAIDAGNRKIGNVGTATENKDVITLEYLNSAFGVGGGSNYLPVIGGTLSGPLNMGGNNITNVNKLTVNTIDPLYRIKGVNYSTFAAAIVGGVKEEYVGRLAIKEKKKDGYFEAVIDFDKLKEGSDLWVWHKTVDFSKDNVEVFLSPYGDFAQTYFVIDKEKLILRSDKAIDVSYRLIGRRVDWQEWPTKAHDQKETPGFIID